MRPHPWRAWAALAFALLVLNFALTFAISWGGMLLLILAGGSGGIPMLAWVAGPPVAGIMFTGLVYGRAGFRDLLTRCVLRGSCPQLLDVPLRTTQ